MRTGNGIFRLLLAIGFLSGATLLFETGLTRFLAVAQFYHFAFLVISLALLGFGASGSILSVFPHIKDQPVEKVLSRIGIGFILSIWLTYLVVNWLPFDSYSIAWERRQILYFILYYFALSLPFLVSGLGLGFALAVTEKEHHQIYAANLVGSGLGVLLAPGILGLSGVLGLFLICSLAGMGSWFLLVINLNKSKTYWIAVATLIIVGLSAWISISMENSRGTSPLGFNISPYKGLSYARQFPGSESVFGKWNHSSRIDVLANAGTRRLPGLSYVYQGEIPPQLGLSVDGNAPQPITLAGSDDFEVGEWLPEWWAFSLFNTPDILVLDPGGGFGILQALLGSPASVTAVIPNPLILQAVEETASEYQVLHHPDVDLVIDDPRAFLAGESGSYELVYLPLTDDYQPVTNGFYSISENYSLTVSGIQSGLSLLSPGGVLVTSRWLQNPPSEGLRLITSLHQALLNMGIQQPENSMVVYRSIQTITAVVRPTGWEQEDLKALRAFLDRCRFDLVWSPNLVTEDLNRWNQLKEPIYHQQIKVFFEAPDKEVFYQSYPYDITPPTDDRPFYFHFYKWSQAPGIVASFGKTWQPFGGSGYFLLIFLLALVLFLSSLMILIPLWLEGRKGQKKAPGAFWIFIYFGSIGIGFMFLEIPLISQWSLFLREPVYAFSLIIGVLLLSSGLGSMVADRSWIQRGLIIPILFLSGVGFILFATLNKELVLSWPAWIRILVPCLGLSPLGFSLGTFFPVGMSWIKNYFPGLVPWAWAVNGSVSVIASVLAAVLSLQGGYPLVISLGVFFYFVSWMIRCLRMP